MPQGLVTILSFANSTLETLTLPVDAKLRTRNLNYIEVAGEAGTAVRFGVGVMNVKQDTGVTNTFVMAQEAATAGGFWRQWPEDSVVCPADAITTFTIATSAALTGTIAVCYKPVIRPGTL